MRFQYIQFFYNFAIMCTAYLYSDNRIKKFIVLLNISVYLIVMKKKKNVLLTTTTPTKNSELKAIIANYKRL